MKIDWPLLRQQKQQVMKAIEQNISRENVEALEGLLCLLDALQDDAATRLGDTVVFGGGDAEGNHAGVEANMVAGKEDTMAGDKFWYLIYRRYVQGINMDYGVRPGYDWQRAVRRCRKMGDSIAAAVIENTIDSESLEDAEKQVRSMIDDLYRCLPEGG